MQSVVILSCWVLGALQGAILILVPEIMVEGQLSALQLALPLSLGTFVFMYCSGQWGGLLDNRFKTNKPIITVLRWVLFGFFFSQLSFLLLLKFPFFKGGALVVGLCLSRILHGVFCSAIIPSSQLLLSRHDHNGEKLVWSSIATNIGRITAPLLTFLPVDVNYFSLWFIAAITLSVSLVTYFYQHTSMFKSEEEESKSQLHVFTDKKIEPFKFLSNTFLLSICVAAVLISLFSSQLQFSLGPILLDKFSNVALATETTAHFLLAASSSALISLFVLYRPLSRFPKLFLSFIVICFIAGCSLFVLQQQFIVAIVLMSAALSMAPVWYTALAMHASQNNKARTSAAVSQGHTLGNAVGGVVAGIFLAFGLQCLLTSLVSFMFLILLVLLSVYCQSNSADNSKTIC